MSLIRDLSDDEARASLVCKWGEVEPDVLPAWVAEMDYAIAEPITAALHEAVARGLTGYPRLGEPAVRWARRTQGSRPVSSATRSIPSG